MRLMDMFPSRQTKEQIDALGREVRDVVLEKTQDSRLAEHIMKDVLEYFDSDVSGRRIGEMIAINGLRGCAEIFAEECVTDILDQMRRVS